MKDATRLLIRMFHIYQFFKVLHIFILILIYIYPLKVAIQIYKVHYFTRLPHYNTTIAISRGANDHGFV